MGTMTFMIPGGLPTEANNALSRACLLRNYDHIPDPTFVQQRPDRILVQHANDESGSLLVPWLVDGAGHLMVTTATLMERVPPYHLIVEIARGKLNQVRCQTSDWEMAGLALSDTLKDLLHRATHAFAQAILDVPQVEAYQQAQIALALSFQAADELINLYTNQLFALRHEKEPKIQSMLGCRISNPLSGSMESEFLTTFNSACIPLTWRSIEPNETSYSWTEADATLEWAESHKLNLCAGPLIDFSSSGIPEWLKAWEGDPLTLASFMCDYVETVINRYKHRIRRWQICSGSNASPILGLAEDDRIRLTARLAEAAWAIDPQLELVIGIAQPWGDYLSTEDNTYSPFVFADTLLRAGLNFAAFELELFMGYSGRGSYCRDVLECSRLIDLFGLLGVPLQLGMSYPTSIENDSLSDPTIGVGDYGFFHEGLNPQGQASWMGKISPASICKPHVVGVYWDHFSDSMIHRLPNGGLFNHSGELLPGLERFRQLRQNHLI
jgi:hypothetical protein